MNNNGPIPLVHPYNISFKVSFDSPNKHIAVNLLLSTINYKHSQPSTHQSINQSSLSTSAQQSANGSTLYKNSNNNSYRAFQTYTYYFVQKNCIFKYAFFVNTIFCVSLPFCNKEHTTKRQSRNHTETSTMRRPKSRQLDE